MKIKMASAVRSHAAWQRHLGEIAANTNLVCADDQAVAVRYAVAQHHAIMSIQPFPLRFHAHIASLCLRVQEETVIGHDDRLFKAHATQLVQCHADQLERAGISPKVVSGLFSS